MISGTYVLTDTIDRAFKNLFSESYAGTDAVVTGRGIDVSIDGESAPDPPVAASVLEDVRGVPEVALATGSILDEQTTKILTPEGDAVSAEGAPTFGFGIDTSPQFAQFNPLNVLEGRWPASGDEVVIDASTADKQGYAVGDTVQISTLQPKRPFELVGVAQYGNVDSLGNATFVVFTIPAAQELLDREGQYDAISAAAKEGTSEDDLVQAIEPVLAAGGTGRERDCGVGEGAGRGERVHLDLPLLPAHVRRHLPLRRGLRHLQHLLDHRRATDARVRHLADDRRVAAAGPRLRDPRVGRDRPPGVAHRARARRADRRGDRGAVRGASGSSSPPADRVFALRTVIVALLVGVGVTLAAGLFPAIRATRVPPIAAVREGASLPQSRFARFTPWIAGLVIVLSLLLLGRAMFTDELGTSDRLLSIAAGVLLLFVGVALISSHVVRPLAVISSPIGRWAAFGFTVLAWPFFLLPYWLQRYGAFGPGSALSRVGAFVAGGLLNPFLLPIVLAMWLRRAVTRWEPEWPMEFPSVVPDRVATRTGGRTPAGTRAGQRRLRLR